ncbi:hypothetical protein D3C71_1332110 [compost metagenome]
MRNHAHAEALRNAGHARADLADAHQPDDGAVDLVAHQVFAREARVVAQALMRFHHAALHRQQQRVRVFGHRRGVAARLVHDGDAGRRAGGHVHRVIARAAGRHAHQVRALGNQFGVHEPLARQFVFGGRHMVGVGRLQARQRAGVVAMRRQHRQGNVGLRADDLVEHGVQPQVQAAQAFREILRSSSKIRHVAQSPYRSSIFV